MCEAINRGYPSGWLEWMVADVRFCFTSVFSFVGEAVLLLYNNRHGEAGREKRRGREGGRKQKEMGGEKPSFRGVFSYSR